MRKILTLIGVVLAAGIYNAQGKVGIKTESPTETFDVQGTARIRELAPAGSDNSIYGGENAKNHSFEATKTIVADKNGVLGYMEGTEDPFGIPVYKKVVKCIEGYFPGKNNLVNANSTIQLEDLEMRLNTPGLFADGPLAYIQAKMNGGEDELVSFFMAGNAIVQRRFHSYSPLHFRDAIKFNYDQEAEAVGTIILHKRKKMYRYSAAGWKESPSSTSGFCHILELIADWSDPRERF